MTNIGSVGYTTTPRKTVKPVAYNGISSTGFKGVRVFQSDTVVNQTVVVNQDNSCCSGKKSGGSFWSKLGGALVGIVGSLGLGAMIAGLFKKDKTDETQQNDKQNDTQQTQPQPETAASRTLFGGQLEEVVVTGDASKAKNGVKPFKSNLPEDLNEAANELKQMYGGIISDIKLEKQSDGTYKATVLIPDTLKHNGATSSTELYNIKSSDDLDTAIMKAMDNLRAVKDNPFASKPETEEAAK